MTMLSTKYGDDWPSYLSAAVFAWNASVCASTNYTPYELIYGGRAPTLFQDIDLNIFNKPTGTPDYSTFRKDAIATLTSAYNDVRTQQEKMSKMNRDAIIARRGANRKTRKDGKPHPLVEYAIGDFVLFGEPVQSKIMQTTAQRLAHITVTKAPKKWKACWTGPHEIRRSKRSSFTKNRAHGIRRSKRSSSQRKNNHAEYRSTRTKDNIAARSRRSEKRTLTRRQIYEVKRAGEVQSR